MLDYETLRVLWWALLGTLLMGFAVMDGFDLGVAAIFRFVGRTDEEKRQLLASVEPVWEGNQVWFILAGGAVFAAWPVLYAASFSGLYLAMFALLLAFILRPVGFAYRDKLPDARWRNGWDWVLLVSGVVPALLFGVAFGNLFLGIPFHFDELQRPVYTGGFLNLLHPYALLVGIVSAAMILMHGASYAALKVAGPLATRAASIGRLAALIFMVGFIAAAVYLAVGIDGDRIVSHVNKLAASSPMSKSVVVSPGAWFDNYREYPALWFVPVLALTGSLSTFVFLTLGSAVPAFLSSCLTQIGTILTAGVALFPFLMPSSTHPAQGLTIWDASSSRKTLSIMLFAVIVFLPVVLIYTTWVFSRAQGQGHPGRNPPP